MSESALTQRAALDQARPRVAATGKPFRVGMALYLAFAAWTGPGLAAAIIGGASGAQGRAAFALGITAFAFHAGAPAGRWFGRLGIGVNTGFAALAGTAAGAFTYATGVALSKALEWL